MNYFKDKNKRFGIITTIVLHLLLLLIFLFTGLTFPVPLPEQGILINFGTSDQGFGDVQPEDVTTTEATDVSEESVLENSANPNESVEEVITQDTEEAPELNNTSPDNVENETVEETEPEPVINPNALYKGKTNDSKTGNEGETGEPGDQGSIDGTPDSKNYNQHGGKGRGFNLSGREILFKPKISENTQETGKVVVSIWVDRYGKVNRATPGAKGSTTTNSHLYKIAKEAAVKAKFSANPDAPEEQRGTIVFEFKVRK